MVNATCLLDGVWHARGTVGLMAVAACGVMLRNIRNYNRIYFN